MYEKLLQLVGKKFAYLGSNWLLIEIMPELDSLVLKRLDSEKRVQTNQYGGAHRYSNETLTLKISNPDTQGYSDEITILLSGIQKTSSS